MMSTLVVRQLHLWLNLAEMQDADNGRFLNAPKSRKVASSATLSRTSPSSSRQSRSRQRSLSTGQLRHQATMGCPPRASTPALARLEATPWLQHRASRRKMGSLSSRPPLNPRNSHQSAPSWIPGLGSTASPDCPLVGMPVVPSVLLARSLGAWLALPSLILWTIRL